MEYITKLIIVWIGLIIMLISAGAIFLSLGTMQEPLSVNMIFGRIYEFIFGKPL